MSVTTTIARSFAASATTTSRQALAGTHFAAYSSCAITRISPSVSVDID